VSRAGIVGSLSHGNTGEMKSLRVYEDGRGRKAEDFWSVRQMRERRLSEVDDNAEAIACAATLSSADIRRATVGLSGSKSARRIDLKPTL
jgi:hypothetical protein